MPETKLSAKGWPYLNGKRWSDITRDERTFCQHLYSLVQKKGVQTFVEKLNVLAQLDGDLKLPVETDWEIGFEVCFYRDVWHSRGKQGPLYSGKRTFDLCLFSDSHIVIIEAKAQQGFSNDRAQLIEFANDRIEVSKIAPGARVLILALASSKYVGEGESRRPLPLSNQTLPLFDGEAVTWKALSTCFDNDLMLARADDIYELPGSNNDYDLTGSQIMEWAREGQRFCVGRQGGLCGRFFQEDLRSQRWSNQLYQVKMCEEPPNTNWFTSADFQDAVSRLPDCI